MILTCSEVTANIQELMSRNNKSDNANYFKENKDNLTLLVHQYMNNSKKCSMCVNPRGKCRENPNSRNCKTISTNKTPGFTCMQTTHTTGQLKADVQTLQDIQKDSQKYLKLIREMNEYDLENRWS